MKKGLTEIVFILDRSGSMRGLEKDTIGGFNSMLEKQKKEEGEAIVSAILFDDKTETVYDRIDIKEIPEMTTEQYYVRGCTALLDAIGFTIEHIKSARKNMNKEDRPEKTIFIITTDGMENSSRHYTYENIKEMIEKRQSKNWEFIFLGANIDVAAEAGKIGIKENRAVKYECNEEGIDLNYRVLNDAVGKMRKAESAEQMCMMLDEEDVLEKIREKSMID